MIACPMCDGDGIGCHRCGQTGELPATEAMKLHEEIYNPHKKSSNRIITDADHETVLAMSRAGMSGRAIGKDLGVSTRAVQAIIRNEKEDT